VTGKASKTQLMWKRHLIFYLRGYSFQGLYVLWSLFKNRWMDDFCRARTTYVMSHANDLSFTAIQQAGFVQWGFFIGDSATFFQQDVVD
jgi:hypothetical protein